MHRVDTPSATVDHKFTEGSPAGGVPATVVPAVWLNDVQENICKAIELAGITLVKGSYSQLYNAISAIASGLNLGAGGNGLNDYVKVKFTDKTTGVIRELILQWGRVSAGGATTGTLTFPLQFPDGCRAIFPSDIRSNPSLTTVAFDGPTLSGCPWFGYSTATAAAIDPGTFYWFALGF